METRKHRPHFYHLDSLMTPSRRHYFLAALFKPLNSPLGPNLLTSVPKRYYCPLRAHPSHTSLTNSFGATIKPYFGLMHSLSWSPPHTPPHPPGNFTHILLHQKIKLY